MAGRAWQHAGRDEGQVLVMGPSQPRLVVPEREPVGPGDHEISVRLLARQILAS